MWQYLGFSLWHTTSGLREVPTERRNLGERSATSEPFKPCYTPRRPKGGECNVARSEAERVKLEFFRS